MIADKRPMMLIAKSNLIIFKYDYKQVIYN